MATLSPLEKLLPRAYVRQMFCFSSTHPDIFHTLKAGLAGVVTDVPYLLSGIVTSDDKSISINEPYQTLDDLFSEEDLSDALDYDVMKEQHFPPSTCSVPGIIPPDTIPPLSNPAPVFQARLTLVKGGFILCVAIHHNTTDITGFGALFKIWASHCRTHSSAAIGFDPAWLNREALRKRPSLSSKPTPTSIPELLHVQGPDDLNRFAGALLRHSDFKTAIYFFPQKTLRALKQAVNDQLTSQDVASWISSGDILTALLWSGILAAESDPKTSAKGNNTIGFPVNFRSRLNPPLPPDYLGAAFVMTAATVSKENLLSFATGASPPSGDMLLDSASISKLAEIASAIRASLRRVDEESVRDMLMYLDIMPDDHPPIILGPRHDGISIVSWADQGVYELDWGNPIGKCDAVRMPRLMYKRYPIVLPRVPSTVNGDGRGLEVIVSLDRQVLEKFEQSWPIKRFASLQCYS
ncbi:transferase family-domain-containing protein [Hypoxylon sp. FL0890]|nr:transferase family-domain-containing protein [Hypoxylon sp. FL0890]